MDNEVLTLIDIYGDNLTAKEYITDPAIARDDEIEQVINGIKKIDITKIKNTYEFQNVFNLQIEESSSNFVKKMIGVKS